jgi:hypothetical protein
MDFSRFDRHTFIADLARAEDDATAALSRMLAPYVHYGAAWVPDWVFHHGERVRRVERALNALPALALSLLGRQLNNIDLREIWPILRGVLEDVALYLGGPAALGGALGGIGFFFLPAASALYRARWPAAPPAPRPGRCCCPCSA